MIGSSFEMPASILTGEDLPGSQLSCEEGGVCLSSWTFCGLGSQLGKAIAADLDAALCPVTRKHILFFLLPQWQHVKAGLWQLLLSSHEAPADPLSCSVHRTARGCIAAIRPPAAPVLCHPLTCQPSGLAICTHIFTYICIFYFLWLSGAELECAPEASLFPFSFQCTT